MKYRGQGDRIMGAKIFLTFEKRVQYSTEKNTGQNRISIKGNPATATIQKVFVYNDE